MKIPYIFLVFFFIVQNVRSQENWEILGGGIFGVSNLKTSYNDFSPIGYSSNNRESILSNPRLMFGVFGECNYSFNDIFTMKSNISFIENGYQYEIFNNLEESSIKAKYKRFDLGLEIGIKAFIFSKKEKVRKRKVLLPYFSLAYNFRIKLKDTYRFADEVLIAVSDSNINNFLSSYLIGFGIKKGKIEFLAFYNPSISNFISGQGSNKIHLNNIGLRVAYVFLN